MTAILAAHIRQMVCIPTTTTERWCPRLEFTVVRLHGGERLVIATSREDGMTNTKVDAKDAEIASLQTQLEKANARIERLRTLIRTRDKAIREARAALRSCVTSPRI